MFSLPVDHHKFKEMNIIHLTFYQDCKLEKQSAVCLYRIIEDITLPVTVYPLQLASYGGGTCLKYDNFDIVSYHNYPN